MEYQGSAVPPPVQAAVVSHTRVSRCAWGLPLGLSVGVGATTKAVAVYHGCIHNLRAACLMQPAAGGIARAPPPPLRGGNHL